MKRKDIILFMIVGTGVNSKSGDEGFRLLAQKLYSTITKIYPHHVVFFSFFRSNDTIGYIEEFFINDNDEFIFE